MPNEIQTAESTAIQKFIAPLDGPLAALLDDSGNGIVAIRSDAQYTRACEAELALKQARKGLESYFKDDPVKRQSECGPGEGLLYFARRALDAGMSLYSKLDARPKQLLAQVQMRASDYRREVERKAREEAEARAAEERRKREAEAKRLEEQAKRKRNVAGQEAESQALLRDAAAKREEAAAVQPVIEREIPKVAGHSVRKVWRAEVTDLRALIETAVRGGVPIDCLVPNESRLNKLAEAWGGQHPPAGVRFVEREISTARSR